tara:strand:+ start:506 stop:1768 length:1263 start_codon:yes stop_codon:yes gene_type:complete
MRILQVIILNLYLIWGLIITEIFQQILFKNLKDIMQIPFHKPLVPKSDKEIFTDTILNGWITTGPAVQKFEKILSSYTNSEFVIAVNSCTAALHLALAAKGFGKGDKFIAPTYTFVASVEVGEYLGMQPILVDCDSSFNFDIDKIEKILKKEKDVKAIIPVHFAGKPVDMKRIKRISDKYNLFILEDAAHALESYSNLGKIGDTSHATAFSFYANKNITTAGEGGALTTNDGAFADKIRKLSLHGMSKDGWKRFSSKGKWYYDVSELGYKYNLTDIAASFGIFQFNYIKDWHSKREKIFNLYQESFKDIGGIILPQNVADIEKHSYHLYVIRLDDSRWRISRNQFINLLNKKGIGTSVHYRPVHMHSYYKNKYLYRDSDFPNASKFFNNVITLPLYPLLKEEEVNYIINIINSIWSKYQI